MKENEQAFSRGTKIEGSNFIGDAFLQMLMTDEKNFDASVYNVSFGPRARNSWHSHPGGQILLVTSGTGCYQEEGGPVRILRAGDVVEIRPDVVHWHGAAPDSEFAHIGITTRAGMGPARWLGPVSDEEYDGSLAAIGYRKV